MSSTLSAAVAELPWQTIAKLAVAIIGVFL
jgi:hypothetical protein